MRHTLSPTGTRVRMAQARWTAASGSLALLVSLALTPVTTVPAGASPAKQVTSARHEPRSPELVASARAAASGSSLVVAERETETLEVVAHPDGSFTATQSIEPVRVERDGAWRDLDSTLHFTRGVVAPKVGLGSLSISAGGPAGTTIARYTRDGVSYSLVSPWKLPRPTLWRSDATYADVLPGVDLVVQATTQGFTHNWVVKTRRAATSSALSTLELPVSTNGLRPVPSAEGISYVDAAGIQRLWSPAPLMWDSSGRHPATSADAVGDGPDRAAAVARVGATATSNMLTLTPRRSMLAARRSVFPVVIDPPLEWSQSRTSWTTVWSTYPATSFYKTSHALGAGYASSQHKLMRSYFQFDTRPFAGVHVLASKLSVNQVRAASCSPRQTDLYRTGVISSATTWNRQPRQYQALGTSNSTAGCNGVSGRTAFDALTALRIASLYRQSTATLLLRAHDEHDPLGWRAYDDNAYLIVDYVTPPQAPTEVGLTTHFSITPACSTDPSAPTVVSTTSITLRATVHAGDSNESMTAVFLRGDSPWVKSTVLHSGQQGAYGWSGLTDGSTYRFRAESEVFWEATGTYGAGHLLSTTSPSDSWCYFTVDTP